MAHKRQSLSISLELSRPNAPVASKQHFPNQSAELCNFTTITVNLFHSAEVT